MYRSFKNAFDSICPSKEDQLHHPSHYNDNNTDKNFVFYRFVYKYFIMPFCSNFILPSTHSSTNPIPPHIAL